MSSPRLRVQFETLFEHFEGQNTEVRLEDVTDILFCTRRNARIVLNKMEEEGWIEWHPAAGRGKLSHLIFKRSRSDVSENLARRYLEEGKFGQALSVLDQNAAKLTQVIQSYLGVQHQQGLQVVRLPYYRPLSMLNPRKQMRRSEQHIARQVFSGLTTLDENETLQPDLAHSWQSLSEKHWRFYLRPGVRFHNGEQLTSELVVDSLRELQCFRLFEHIDDVTTPGDWVIDIHLSKPDVHLPVLLAETCAKIVSSSVQQDNEFDLMPVGTGPFKIVINDDKRLILQAFDGYFGYRPLLDKIEVCVIDEAHSSLVFPTLNTPIKMRRGSSREDVDLDPGCIYLQLNRKDGIAQDQVWAEYLSSKLSALSLFKLFPEETVVEWGMLPAHGLKPGWYHHRPGRQPIVPPVSRPLRIAYHARHPMFPHLIEVIQTLLNQDGIQVELMTYEHSVQVMQDVDIWIKAMGISNHRDDALAGWLLNYSDVSETSQPQDFAYWQQLIDFWRAGNSQIFPAKEIGKSLIEKHQIVPLFHSWLGVSHDQCGALQNAKCNALGWFDFCRVWVKPELD
ncbi:SgrR family transcriptional regulator [Vibrio mangrovi]|uniref:HTH-type transcriptional regulator SgrR n=1 Tax=Vibrio mangrovi TaxID=474394 RepID=A0A1Y6IST1_9VIBR|nr:SgrR family transcriptional regulator [Vibrio mangrovi]MDW6005557.1 SgrR family transcriptional regulator [Vibrio mangrovi]SMS00729.1 HTH-type transcriptional regulator SgrR [Vibrio mangrovi]